MSQLSFAQILQKKKSDNTITNNSSRNSYVNTSKLLQSQLTTNETQYPSLKQLMDQFIQYPNDPEQNFILSFDASDREQFYQDYGTSSQDFEGGLNPLDSFIMSQSYINANKPKGTKFSASNRNQVGKTSRQFNMNQLCKHYINTKENKSFNQPNTDNLYKFSSKNYRESMQNSQHQFINDSNKYYQANTAGYLKQPSNKQMIVNTKIIQSQSYQNGAVCESKRENIPKIQRSEKIGMKVVEKLDIEENRKIPRYQVNYQQSQRKQVAEPPKQKKKLIISKMLQQKNNPSKISSQSSNSMHLSKKQQQQQQLLIPDIPIVQKIQKITQIHKKTQTHQVNPVCTLENELNEQQKRIQDAKKQINQYLSIRQKSSKQEQVITVTKPAFYKQQTTKIIDVLNNATTTQQIIINNKYSQNVTNYSFAHNQIQSNRNSPSTHHVKNCDSFEETKKKLKQIEEQKRAKQNERFLGCIEYTQSEVDVDDQDEGKVDIAAYKRNLQVSQSIPERKQRRECQPYTLQKYMPNNQQKIQSIKPQQSKPYLPDDRTQNYSQQYSQIIQKVQVQPSVSSIQQESQNAVNNSEHPCLQYQLSSQSQRQVQVKEPYHDVSSIDIRASGSIGEQFIMPSGEKQIRMQIDDSASRQNKEENDNGTKQMEIPKLNITDFQSASNMSCPSPIKTPSNNQNQSQSQVQSHQPVSSNQSIKLHVQQNQNNYGFIYKMRVHSRNNSFTSNYDSRVHGQVGRQGDWKDGCGSNHSSMYIKQESKKQDNQDIISVQQYNMSKYKNNNKQYDEVDASVNIKELQNISSSNNKPHESIQLPVINLQQSANLSSCQPQLMMANNYPQQPPLHSQQQNIHQENILQQPTVYQQKQIIIQQQQVYIPQLNTIVNQSISYPDQMQETKEKQNTHDVKVQQKQQIIQQYIIQSQTTVQQEQPQKQQQQEQPQKQQQQQQQYQQQLINIKQQDHTIDKKQIQQKLYVNIPADIKQSTKQILINIEPQAKVITQNIQIANKIQINSSVNTPYDTVYTSQQIYNKQVHGQKNQKVQQAKHDNKQDKISSSLSIPTIIQPQIPHIIIQQTVIQQPPIIPQTKLQQPKFVKTYDIPQKITQNSPIKIAKIQQPKFSTYIQIKSSLKSSIKGVSIMVNKSIKNDKDQQPFEFDLDF